MKKLICLFSFTLLLTASSLTASASTGTTTTNGGDNLITSILDLLGLGGSGSGSGSTSGSTTTANGGGTCSSTQLPINNGIVFLMIAGVAIGIVTLKKNNVKTAELKA
jgi:hypothetical protein